MDVGEVTVYVCSQYSSFMDLVAGLPIGGQLNTDSRARWDHMAVMIPRPMHRSGSGQQQTIALRSSPTFAFICGTCCRREDKVNEQLSHYNNLDKILNRQECGWGGGKGSGS